MSARAAIQPTIPPALACLILLAGSVPQAAMAQWNDPWNRGPSYPQMSHQGRNTGAVAGGVAGGLLGAAIGSRNDNTGEGALIGGLAGAVAGGLLGNQRDRAIYNGQQAQYQDWQQAMGAALTYNDVIQMSQSGLGDDIIARQISQRGIARRPDTNDLIMLKQYGVSDRVIGTMQSAWSPADGVRRAAPVQQRYYAPEPAPVVVETWSPPPVYVVPAPRYYVAPPCHHHHFSWGFGF